MLKLTIMKRKKVSTQNNNFAVRDATRTPFIHAQGYIPNSDKDINREDVDITEGPMGWFPVIGDILQAGQAAIDLSNKKYGKAALGAGLLLVPNVAEKPVKQILKNGAERILRKAPKETVDLMDALMHPYKGQNFVTHGAGYFNIDDVLSGETRAMSPSLGVSRMGDINNANFIDPLYGNYNFIGDKSWLDNVLLFNGDADTPVVSDVINMTENIPSTKRESVAKDVWEKTLGDRGSSKMKINISDLNYLDTPTVGYFEAKYNGLLPLETSKYALFPEPYSSVDPFGKIKSNKGELIIKSYEDLGLPIITYSSKDDRMIKLLQLLEDHPELRFKYGGLISRLQNHYKDGGEILKAIQSAKNKKLGTNGILLHNFAEGGSTVDENDPTFVGPTFPIVGPSKPIDSEAIVDRQRYAESSYNNKSVNKKSGAKGPYQIRDIVLKEYIDNGGEKGDLFDPEYSRKVRDWYINNRFNRYEMMRLGNPSDSVKTARRYAAYNWGPVALGSALKKMQAEGIDIDNSWDWLDHLPEETRNYVNFVVRGMDVPGTSKTAARHRVASAVLKDQGGTIERLVSMHGGDRAKTIETLKKIRGIK